MGGLIVLVAIAGMYKFNYLASQPGYDVDGNKEEKISDPKNATYTFDGVSVTLIDGFSEVEVVEGSATKETTQYFGNEVKTDLNNDGREDTVFLVARNTGGTGTFFYAVASLNTEEGWKGSQAFLLGDRIAPQTTEVSNNPSHENVVVVNYLEHGLNQTMSEQPSVGKSVWLKLDVESMSFGTVEQDFPGEANPEVMTLEMKQWTWVETTYDDGAKLTPNKADAFTLAFAEDGSLSVGTDCNSMGGRYEVDGNKVMFGPMFSTKMFCQDSQEQDFAAMLADTELFSFTSKGELILTFKLAKGSATFR